VRCFRNRGTIKAAAGRRTAKAVLMRFDSPLKNVRVASPCPADWDQMLGNDRSRFCGQCNLNVYNLSAMSLAEAENFIARSEGRVCIRYYKRNDGSIITENCPVGLRALRKKMSYVARSIASALLALVSGIGLFHIFERVKPVTMMGDMVAQPPKGTIVAEPLIVDINLVPPPVAVAGRMVIIKPKPKGRRSR